MEAIKLKGRIGVNATLEWIEPLPDLPPGEVEIIVLYKQRSEPEKKRLLPDQWPVLHGGQYLGGTLRREDIYDDDGR
jgi:hypothetical protein